MGKFSSSSSTTKSKKKKGPKGKKARAKAKLDRQWGEEDLSLLKTKTKTKTTTKANYEQLKETNINSNKTTTTNNNLKSIRWGDNGIVISDNDNRTKTKRTTHNYSRKWNYNDDDDNNNNDKIMTIIEDEDESDNDNDSDIEEAPLTNLLQSIHKKKKKMKQRRQKKKQQSYYSDSDNDDDDDDDSYNNNNNYDNYQDSSENSIESDNDDDNDSIMESNDDDDNDDDDYLEYEVQQENEKTGLENNNTYNGKIIDLFRERFGREPFKKEIIKNLSSLSTTTTTTTTTKVSILNTDLEMQITVPSSLVSKNNSTSTTTTTTTTIDDEKNDYSNINYILSKLDSNSNTSFDETKTTTTTTTTTKPGKDNNNNNNNKILTKTNQEWNQIVYNSFQNNRQILQRQWNNNNNNNNNIKPKKRHTNNIMSWNQSQLYPFMTRYNDLLIPTNNSIKYRNQIHKLSLLHILNHVLTSRGRIQRNNRQLKEQEKRNDNDDDDDDDDDNSMDVDNDDDTSKKKKNNKTKKKKKKVNNNHDIDENKWRDQGYTRSTVLVLLPTRGTCYKFVHDLLDMVGYNNCNTATANNNNNNDTSRNHQQNTYFERFEAEYGVVSEENENDDDDNNNNNNTNNNNKEKERRRKLVLQQKGQSWLELFGDDTNQDDDFKIGITLTPKAVSNNKNEKSDTTTTNNNSNISVKLYSDFFNSDIIIASPIGLKMLITPNDDDDDHDDNENDNDGSSRRRHNNNNNRRGSTNSDFLSSIEICLLEYSDVLLMQNWDHVNDILKLLNQLPKNNNNTDFSRVRNYYLEEQSQYFRQLIIKTNIIDPCIVSTFKRYSKSYNGSIRIRQRIVPENATIAKVLIPIKHTFQQIVIKSLTEQTTTKISYFMKYFLPLIKKRKQKHTLIYIPSYFDFCSLRNILLKESSRIIDFVSVTEYSRISEVGRGRARFLQGIKPIMLYTGRAHFFHRHLIKGVRHLIFFSPPEHGEFYSDHVNNISSSSFSKHMSNDDDDDDDNDGLTGEATTSCTVLFTKYDAHALERIVGTSNCTRMMKSDKTTFKFFS